jgi:hypothetical protein
MRVEHPLGWLVGGLALVWLDFRLTTLDLLLDPVGGVVIAIAAVGLRLRGGAGGSVTVAALSITDASLQGGYRRIAPVTGWRLGALAGSVILGVVVLLTLLHQLQGRARVHGDEPAVARLGLLKWAVGLAWGVPPAVGILAALVADPVAYDPIWNGSAEYAALVGWLAIAWVAAELWIRAGEGWARPDQGLEVGPWTELMVRRGAPPPRDGARRG